MLNKLLISLSVASLLTCSVVADDMSDDLAGFGEEEVVVDESDDLAGFGDEDTALDDLDGFSEEDESEEVLHVAQEEESLFTISEIGRASCRERVVRAV